MATRHMIVIFCLRPRSAATSAGCAFICAPYVEHSCPNFAMSPSLKHCSSSASHAYGVSCSDLTCEQQLRQ